MGVAPRFARRRAQSRQGGSAQPMLLRVREPFRALARQSYSYFSRKASAVQGNGSPAMRFAGAGCIPVPPGQSQHPLGNVLREAKADRFGCHTADNSVGIDILGHHGARSHHRAMANRHFGLDDRRMADPCVMSDHGLAAGSIGEPVLIVFGIIPVSPQTGTGNDAETPFPSGDRLLRSA